MFELMLVDETNPRAGVGRIVVIIDVVDEAAAGRDTTADGELVLVGLVGREGQCLLGGEAGADGDDQPVSL